MDRLGSQVVVDGAHKEEMVQVLVGAGTKGTCRCVDEVEAMEVSVDGDVSAE